MAKNILPLIRPLEEIKADLEFKTEEVKADLEILYANAIAYENLLRSIMANKRLSVEIASRWVRKNNYVFFDRDFRENWFLIPKEAPKSS